jgi:hypothetical protein
MSADGKTRRWFGGWIIIRTMKVGYIVKQTHLIAPDRPNLAREDQGFSPSAQRE